MLAQQAADANRAETEASISQYTRDATARRIKEEENKLLFENRQQTYDTWRTEVGERITFVDELISQVEDEDLRRELSRQKDRALADLVETRLLPMVRNIPRASEPSGGLHLLPAAGDDGRPHD